MKLTTERLETDPKGAHWDGADQDDANGLQLVVRITKAGNRTWYLRLRYPGPDGKRIDQSLGKLADLDAAREQAAATYQAAQAARGVERAQPAVDAAITAAKRMNLPDMERIVGAIIQSHMPPGIGVEEPPDAEPSRPGAAPTFAEAAEEWLAVSGRKERPRKEAAARLKRWAAPLTNVPVDTIKRRDVAAVLEPHYREGRRGTAIQLRSNICSVLDWAIAADHIEDNVAAGRALTKLLPPLPDEKNRAAVSIDEAPAVFAKLPDTDPAAAVRLLALTAVRPIEAGAAEQAEFDLSKGRWTIPSRRMKTGREHIVPLPEQAAALVAERLDGGRLLFPGFGARARPTSYMVRALRAVTDEAVPHGWRSTFRDWCAENGVAFEVAEACLAHANGNATVQAYMRTKMVDRRRPVMQDWADYLTG